MKKNNTLKITKYLLIFVLLFVFFACNDPSGGGSSSNPYQSSLNNITREVQNLEERNKLELELGKQLMNSSQANFDDLGKIALQIENLNTKNESFNQQSKNILDELRRLSDEFEKKRSLVVSSDSNEKHYLDLSIININGLVARLINLQNNKKLDQLIQGYKNLTQRFKNLRKSMKFNFEIIKSGLRDTIQSRQTMIEKIEKAIDNMTK